MARRSSRVAVEVLRVRGIPHVRRSYRLFGPVATGSRSAGRTRKLSGRRRPAAVCHCFAPASRPPHGQSFPAACWNPCRGVPSATSRQRGRQGTNPAARRPGFQPSLRRRKAAPCPRVCGLTAPGLQSNAACSLGRLLPALQFFPRVAVRTPFERGGRVTARDGRRDPGSSPPRVAPSPVPQGRSLDREASRTWLGRPPPCAFSLFRSQFSLLFDSGSRGSRQFARPYTGGRARFAATPSQVAPSGSPPPRGPRQRPGGPSSLRRGESRAQSIRPLNSGAGCRW